MYEPASGPSSAMYELRPLTTGEIFDRTFALYRRRFWLYCGLSGIASAVAVLANLAQMIWLANLSPQGQKHAAAGVAGAANGAAAFQAVLPGLLVTYGVLFIHFLVYSITQAATVSAVSSQYLGHETSIKTSLRAVIGKWWKWAAIAFWQGWSALWIFFVLLIPGIMLVAMKIDGLTAIGGVILFLAFLSIFYGVVAYIRNSLAIAASVFERLPIRASMRRSKVLAAGMKWRLFLLLMMLFILQMVAGMLQLPFVMMLTPAAHVGHRIWVQGGSLIMLFVTGSLVTPIGALAFSLFYFDARVRKEGFDIEALMDRSLGSPLLKPAPPPVLLPSGFAPSGFTAEPPPPAPASPFAPSEFTAPAPPFAPSQFTATASPFAPSEFTSQSKRDGELG